MTDTIESDLILHGGNVITLDGSSRHAEAIGVKSGNITSVGSREEVMRTAAPATRLIDVSGRTVTPGFFDSHPHMDRSGLKMRGGVPLDGCKSIAAILDVVRQAVDRTPRGEWIVLMPMGSGPLEYVYRPDQLEEGRFPTRHDLDTVAPNHPVYIRAPWGFWSHRPFPSVANTKAMEVAGVTRASQPPYQVVMEKDDAGEPTGVFLDRNYAPLVEYALFPCLPRFTYEDRIFSARHGAAIYSSLGTTSGFEGHGLTPALLHAYRHVHEAGELSVRMQLALSIPTSAFDNRQLSNILHEWARQLAWRGRGDDILRFEGICIDFGDPESAKPIAAGYPYEQWAGHFRQSLSYERFVEIGLIAAKLGLRVHCCVPYDLESALRAYEAIDRQIRIADRRWTLIHIIKATPEQMRRMKALGVAVTVNPNFMYMAKDRWGLDKHGEEGVPIRQLLDTGIPVSLSTDNVPPSMLFAMTQALTRWSADMQTRLGESRLTRDEALRLATKAGHYLTWHEDSRGSIAPGQVADLVVLDGDPLTCDERSISSIKVERTFLGGREVFAAPTSYVEHETNDIGRYHSGI